jgi:hypothetical protein
LLVIGGSLGKETLRTVERFKDGASWEIAANMPLPEAFSYFACATS